MTRLEALRKRIQSGKATFADSAEYVRLLSQLTGQELAAEVLTLEDRAGTAAALLRERYADVNAACADVQNGLDERRGVSIAPQKAKFPTERVDKFTSSLTDPTVPDETIVRRAKAGAENITMSFHDDFIQANADFRDRAGLKCYVERIATANCCQWCTDIAGKYEMKDQPQGLFGRHDNCDCVIIYDGQVLRGQMGENGRRGRKWVEEKDRAARIEYAAAAKPVRNTPEQAAEMERKLLDNSGNSGIINHAKAIDSMFYADDYEYQTYTKEEIVEHLKTSPVGIDTMRYLEENPQVKVMLSESRERADRGQHDNNLLTIWLNNCPNVRVAAQTIVHEVAHHKYGIGGSQLAETICFAFEKMHKEGRDYVTREEWDKLADLVKTVYHGYPTDGGVGDFGRFKNIIKDR